MRPFLKTLLQRSLKVSLLLFADLFKAAFPIVNVCNTSMDKFSAIFTPKRILYVPREYDFWPIPQQSGAKELYIW